MEGWHGDFNGRSRAFSMELSGWSSSAMRFWAEGKTRQGGGQRPTKLLQLRRRALWSESLRAEEDEAPEPGESAAKPWEHAPADQANALANNASATGTPNDPESLRALVAV